jgi:hypothetical protein
MSIQQNFPSTRPSLNLNFARSQKLDPRITFTRTSSATRVNSDGLIEVVPANSPRFDFDPISGESLGLLVEEQRSNLLTYSEQFNDAAWSVARCTISANTSVSPDGLTTADTLVEDTTNNSHPVFRTIAGLANATSYTASVYIKASGRDKVRVALANSAFAASTFIDYDLVTVTATTSNATGTIAHIGNGWYRCTITATTIAAASGDIFIQPRNAAGNSFYLGTGVNALILWGAQLEQGSFPTSYIPTTTSTATRTADNASITGSNFSDFYNPSEGTFNIKYNRSLLPIGPILGQNISTSSVLNGYLINQSGTGNVIITNADGLTNITVGTSSGGKSSVAFYYSPTGHSGCLNGNSVIESLVPPTRTPVSLLFGRNPNNNTNLNGHISQLTYYPTRLSNQVLQTLTK